MSDFKPLLPALAFAMLAAACGPEDSSNAVTDVPDDGVPEADMGSPDMVAEPDAAEPDMGPQGAEKLFEYGPYPVGFAEFEVTYSPPGATEPRVIPVKVWYPAVADSDAPQAQYAVSGVVDVTTDVALAEPEAAEGEFPVAFYSHGSGGEGLLAYPFGERFASWGWILVSPNHVGNTALDAIRGESAPFAQTALYRVTDVSAVLDAVDAAQTGAPFDNRADLEHVFMFGHSFGGYTTLAAGGADFDYDGLFSVCPTNQDDGSCDFLALPEVEAAFRDGFGDDRVDAIVPQAPALVPAFVDGAIAGIDVPTMIQSGDRDATTPNSREAQPAWEALDGESDVWVRIPDGAHFTFITICYDLTEALINAFRPEAYMDGCGEDFIDPREAIPVLNAYLFAFADTHVLGSDAWTDVLDGTEELNDGFTVTTP